MQNKSSFPIEPKRFNRLARLLRIQQQKNFRQTLKEIYLFDEYAKYQGSIDRQIIDINHSIIRHGELPITESMCMQYYPKSYVRRFLVSVYQDEITPFQKRLIDKLKRLQDETKAFTTNHTTRCKNLAIISKNKEAEFVTLIRKIRMTELILCHQLKGITPDELYKKFNIERNIYIQEKGRTT